MEPKGNKVHQFPGKKQSEHHVALISKKVRVHSLQVLLRPQSTFPLKQVFSFGLTPIGLSRAYQELANQKVDRVNRNGSLHLKLILLKPKQPHEEHVMRGILVDLVKVFFEAFDEFKGGQEVADVNQEHHSRVERDALGVRVCNLRGTGIQRRLAHLAEQREEQD